MRDDERQLPDDLHDKTIAHLLLHLKQIRQAVPVNYRLKADLKQKLLEQMKQAEAMQTAKQEQAIEPPTRKRFFPLWIGAAVVLAVGIAVVLFSRNSIHLENKTAISLPQNSFTEQTAISPRGDEIAVVMNEAKITTYSVETKSREKIIALPQTDGIYQAIAWSASGRQLAVVEQTNEVARLWAVDFDQEARQYGSRLIWEEKHANFLEPAWNPMGGQIAFTREDKDGKQAVYLVSTSTFEADKVTDGSQPDWSQDGKSLAFTKQGQVMVLNLETKELQRIEQGSWPSWNSENGFTYVTKDQQLMDVELDPKNHAVHSTHLVDSDAEKLIRANWSRDGKSLLLISGAKPNEVSIAKRDQ